MTDLLTLPQRFRLRLESGATGVLVYSLDGRRSFSHESPFDAAAFESVTPESLALQCGFETQPDPGAALAYGVLNTLGGGTVEDLRAPADIERIRKACEIPEDAVA